MVHLTHHFVGVLQLLQWVTGVADAMTPKIWVILTFFFRLLEIETVVRLGGNTQGSTSSYAYKCFQVSLLLYKLEKYFFSLIV